MRGAESAAFGRWPLDEATRSYLDALVAAHQGDLEVAKQQLAAAVQADPELRHRASEDPMLRRLLNGFGQSGAPDSQAYA